MNISNENFAVLIDADNISHTKIKSILDEIASELPTNQMLSGFGDISISSLFLLLPAIAF